MLYKGYTTVGIPGMQPWRGYMCLGNSVTLVGLGQIELRTSKKRTSGWTLLDMKCFEFEFKSPVY